VAKNSGDGSEELDAEDTGGTLLPLAGFSEVEAAARGKASAPAAACLLRVLRGIVDEKEAKVSEKSKNPQRFTSPKAVWSDPQQSALMPGT